MEKGVWLGATTRQSKCNWSAVDQKFDLLHFLFKKQDTETIIHFVAVLHHDSFTVNFRLQFKFHKKLSLAEKERVSSDYNHIIITSPLACWTPCLQIDNFCLFPYAACCNCWMLAAGNSFCCQTFLLQRFLWTFWNSMLRLPPHYACDYVCMTAGLGLSVTAHCALILFPANKKIPWHNYLIGLNLCPIQ